MDIKEIKRRIKTFGCDVDKPKHFDVERVAAELENYSWSGGEEELDYNRRHLNRYLITLDQLYGLPRSDRVLDVGGCDAMKIIMEKYLFDRVTITGFAEKDSDERQKVYSSQHRISYKDGKTFADFETPHFNVEQHTWPFPDESFDIVMAGEVFEHLALDPMHAISEANRVLKTGGTLLISVPNVASYSNLLRLFRAEQPSTFPVYRPEGVNLRHNRELTARELAALFNCGGFDAVNLDTFNASPSLVRSKHVLAMGMLCKILHGPRQHRKDTLIGTAKKVGEVRDRYPVELRLYYQWDVERLRSQSIGEEQTKD